MCCISTKSAILKLGIYYKCSYSDIQCACMRMYWCILFYFSKVVVTHNKRIWERNGRKKNAWIHQKLYGIRLSVCKQIIEILFENNVWYVYEERLMLYVFQLKLNKKKTDAMNMLCVECLVQLPVLLFCCYCCLVVFIVCNHVAAYTFLFSFSLIQKCIRRQWNWMLKKKKEK